MPKRKKWRNNSRSVRGAADRALKRRMKRAFGKTQVIVGVAPDGIKMSEVLEEFLEPYKDSAKTKEAFHKLATLAVVAWNATLFPDKERRSLFLHEVLGAFPQDARETGGIIIEKMIVRKERFFPHHRRMILGFEVEETDASWHLVVMSSAKPV